MTGIKFKSWAAKTYIALNQLSGATALLPFLPK
jgi:hypothetical protein